MWPSSLQDKDKNVTKVQASKFADVLAKLQEDREKLREEQDLSGAPILLRQDFCVNALVFT